MFQLPRSVNILTLMYNNYFEIVLLKKKFNKTEEGSFSWKQIYL